ncbi:L,D-transpeptidase family protein [Flavobacterium sp. JP2137]|uniref:L,D-transpeptidase family protein n=1 Tax=Flavobacterium sp. JP2137 TaxID=3414510 RepID=UPI003D2FF5DE
MKYFSILSLICLGLISCQKTKHPVSVVINDTIALSPIDAVSAIAFDSLLLKDKSAELQRFYRYNQFKTVWAEESNRKALIESIEKIHEDGLTDRPYDLARLKQNNDGYIKIADVEKIHTDLMFSESFFKLSNDLYNGRLDPKKLYTDWDLDPKKINTGATMHVALENNAIAQSLDSLRPKNAIYNGLRAALSRLRELPDETFDEFGTGRKIKRNDSLPEIVELKKRLIYWGDLKPEEHSARFNAETEAGLKRFQGRNGLDETGLLDKETVSTLNQTKAQKISQILANLERWRWYPRDLGTDYVLVNIPDYSLVAVSNGDTIQRHKVIVGKPARKTPILSSKFSGLVINPTWTVPPTILKNDLTPAATKNRGYFASRGFTIYDNKGQVVSAQDWNPERASSYRYVQKPGNSNSLGRIKFDFKNNHMVYLHDTNNTNNFNKDDRDLSSGCIRVQNPFDLADYILKTEKNPYTKAKIEAMLKTEKTQGIPLKKSVQIHQFYWTAWNSKEGIQFRTDIYHLDDDLAAKLL